MKLDINAKLGLWILTAVTLMLFMTSCGCDTDFSTCKYQVGDQVRILNKSTHNGATVTDISCGCERYYVEYFSTGGVARMRYLSEGALAPKDEVGSDEANDGYLDKVIDGAVKVNRIKKLLE